MGSCDFARVFGANIQGSRACGARGITCYGNGRMFSVLEEVDMGIDPDGYPVPYPQRLVHSFDNGATWAVYDTYQSKWNIWFWHQISPQTDRILVGNEGPDQGFANYYYDAGIGEWVLIDPSYYTKDMSIALSNDGGITWVPAIPDDFYDTSPESEDYYDGMGFVLAGSGVVFAYGSFTAHGVTYDLLRSTDNGASFAISPADRSRIYGGTSSYGYITSGCYCGNDIVLMGEGITVGPEAPQVLRSTDNGTTWTRMALPLTQHSPLLTGSRYVNTLAFLGNHTVLATGVCGWLGYSGVNARYWRSIDDGATWVEVTDSLPPYGALYRWNGATIVPWSDGLHAIMTGPPISDIYPVAYFTEDGGLSWQNCTSTPPRSNVNDVVDAGIADDGSVCLTVNMNNASYDGYDYEIWRAVPSWTVPGPCYVPVPPPTPIPGPAPSPAPGPCPTLDSFYTRREGQPMDEGGGPVWTG